MTYFICSCVSRHWKLSFQNRSRELFPPIADSMFVKFKRICESVIEVFLGVKFLCLEIRIRQKLDNLSDVGPLSVENEALLKCNFTS